MESPCARSRPFWNLRRNMHAPCASRSRTILVTVPLQADTLSPIVISGGIGRGQQVPFTVSPALRREVTTKSTGDKVTDKKFLAGAWSIHTARTVLLLGDSIHCSRRLTYLEGGVCVLKLSARVSLYKREPRPIRQVTKRTEQHQARTTRDTPTLQSPFLSVRNSETRSFDV